MRASVSGVVGEEPEARVVARRPLEVVHERPGEVAADVGLPRAHRGSQRAQMVEEVGGALVVVGVGEPFSVTYTGSS